VPPPVPTSFLRLRHVLLMLSFVLFVVLPGGGAAWYLWERAADQYVSKVGFSVRREDNSSAIELLGGLANLSGSSSTDTDILYEFIQSQRLVLDIDETLDLRKIWSRPENDPVFSLEADASIEELVEYWGRMVRLSYGAGSGLLEVEVRAFTPEEATAIAERLFAESSEMINQLSAIAREDAIGYAREELDVALERLRVARETVTRFRNENQLINPEIDLQSQAGLLSTLQAQQAETLIEIDLLRDTSRAGDPRLEQAERRLVVIERRISAERQKLGFQGAGEDDKAFSEIVGEYERLVVDREFAERAYVSALAAYDGALAEARRKTRYLAAYLEPTRAETAQYPERLTVLMLVVLFLFLIWSIVSLVLYSVKDRR
jgi:capsular polysaccharide transport system permease protein